MVAEAVANEKGVPRAVIIEALEAALASAAKKRYPDEDVLVRVAINPKDGSYETFRRWEIRSEEHTSELQSLMRISYAVFCLKKKLTSDELLLVNYAHRRVHKGELLAATAL